MIILTPFSTAAELENILFFKPYISTMGNLTVLKTSSVPRTMTSKIPRAVLRHKLYPAAVIFIFLVCSSILDSTPRISSGSMKCFNDPESTKSWKPSEFFFKGGMTHRETEPYARWRIIRFFINFRAFIFDFSVTATLITVGHITIRNERSILCTFTARERITVTISLVIALVIRAASTLVVPAPLFFIFAI